MPSNTNENGGDVAAQQPTANTSNRRVLGDVSPNVKTATQVSTFLKKPAAGSPLKRSFTASMEGGEGLMYLKKRKLSDDEFLSQADEASRSMSRDENEGMERFRPIFQPTSTKDFQPMVPEIAEPSPTEPNTPSDNGDSNQDSSAERQSFSSLINYDPSSQTTGLAFNSLSHAEMLKLRLRIAMYKVRTNQIDTPFKDLSVPDRSRTSKSATAQAVEEAVAQLRREAQQVNARELASIPKLLPSAPILKPTAYSSRMIYGTRMPSSPPVSGSPEKLAWASGELPTPQRGTRQYGTPQRGVDRFVMPEELTSSAVKGRVAEGLLGLRHAS